MIEKTFEQVCNLFFETTQLPLTICKQDGVPLYWISGSALSDVPVEGNRALIVKHEQRSSGQTIPLVEITDPTFYLAVIQLTEDQYCLVGPAAPVHYEEPYLERFSASRGIPVERQQAYCAQLKRMPTFTFRTFLNIVSLLNYALNKIIVPPDEILLQHPTYHINMDETLTHTLFHARENQVVHTTASFENYILQAITDGDVIKLKQAMRSPVSGQAGKMSSNPVRQEKYTFISFATLVTRAAIAGGLNPELAYSLSDIYCQTVDQTNDVLEITRMEVEMCVEFAEKVAAAHGKAELSPIIATCCEYISSHLHHEITLHQLAARVRLGTKSLSKKFKVETGVSVNDYIHRERIKEARSLLEYSDYSISEVGYFLRYNSQSYFSTIFKKFSGITPQQFRNQIKITKLH